VKLRRSFEATTFSYSKVKTISNKCGEEWNWRFIFKKFYRQYTFYSRDFSANLAVFG